MTILDAVPPPVQDRVSQCVHDTRQFAAARLAECPHGLLRKCARRAATRVSHAADLVELAVDLVGLGRAIGDMGLRTLELVSLFEEHPDGLSRVLSVMRRGAAHVLGDDEAEPVGVWAANLERGDGVVA